MKAWRIWWLGALMAGLVSASWVSPSIAADGKVSANVVRPAVQLTSERSYAPVRFADLNERTRYSIIDARYGSRYYAAYPYRYGYARPYYRPYYAYRPNVYRPYYAYRPYYPGYYYGYSPSYYPPAVVTYPYGGAYYW